MCTCHLTQMNNSQNADQDTGSAAQLFLFIESMKWRALILPHAGGGGSKL
ncbi:Hypothetical predicted protein [Podarcis lilfordi]|uniref:Uncharacterized protein n=1 Tax=Podarcis lilfordi TaxID=74358 RepID=A0AA35KV37_9SAUR|nr:Hypothetical predicted protein [Podarcis lilfordi]